MFLGCGIVVGVWHFRHSLTFTSFMAFYPKQSLCKLNAFYAALLRHGVGNACTSPSSLADNNIFILVVAKR